MFYICKHLNIRARNLNMIIHFGYMITFDEMIHMIYEKIKLFVISILPPYAKFSVGLDFLKDIDID